jgi:small-conductance mechanosensitive channel
MEDLLINTRPIWFGLVGFIILFYNHLNTKKRWDEKAPKQLTHPLIRTVLASLTFAVIVFIVSMFFTTSLVYTLINTVILEVFFLLYLAKILVDAKKFRSKLRRN